jgi:hypothetical protein
VQKVCTLKRVAFDMAAGDGAGSNDRFMSWKRIFREVEACGERIAIVDMQGRALALAGWEEHLVGRESALLGLGWVEMAHPDDLEMIFAWFADPGNSGPMVHRGMWRLDDVVSIVSVACVKVWIGEAWLVVYALGGLPPPAAASLRLPRDRCAVAPNLPCQDCPECLLE